MKRTLVAAAALALAAFAGAANAGVSWSVIVAPGVYGRVAIGGYAEPPQVYSPDPIVVVGQPAYVQQDPVYLWVPPLHRLHWAQYCGAYGACGVPVYFVQDGWYNGYVMHRHWSPEQRGWTQAQWIEQDRIARERWEHARWDREHAFEQQRHDQFEARRAQEHWDQARYDHERAEMDRQDRAHWEQAHGRGVQAVAAWQPGAPRAAAPEMRPGDQRDHAQGERGYGGDPRREGEGQR